MNFSAKNRKGLGTVITTPLILVASIILGAGAIFLGGSMFQTNEQIESIKVSNTHIWLSPNGTSTAAFVVQNSGGKQVAISSISIRGISTSMSQVWFNKVGATSATIQTELEADYSENAVNIDGEAGEEAFTLATGPVSLSQGEAAIIYLNEPANITALDAGLSMTLKVKAGGASAVLPSVHVVFS